MLQDVVDFIGAKLKEGMSPCQAASALLDACLANDPREARGVGCDNMTSVVVELKFDSQSMDTAEAPAAAS